MCIARSFRDSVWLRGCCAASSRRKTGWRRFPRGRAACRAVGVVGVSHVAILVDGEKRQTACAGESVVLELESETDALA